MMKNLVLLATAALLALPSYANTGVFHGSGNQVMPIREDRVRLVREHVKMRIEIGDEGEKYGLPFIPWVNVTAEFECHNTSDEAVELQLGFPFLDLQGFGDEDFVISNMDFTVESGGQDVAVALKEGVIEEELDPDGMFQKVFVWDEIFDADETKIFVVSYRMLMGVSSMNTAHFGVDELTRKYEEIDELIPALGFWFGYITQTAYTWKPPLDEAVFEVDVSEFEKAIGRDDVWSNVETLEQFRVADPIVYEYQLPGFVVREGSVRRWLYEGEVPEDGLSIGFAAVFLPQDVEVANKHLALLGEELNRCTPEELRLVVAEYYRILGGGARSENEFIKGYVEGTWLDQYQGALVSPETREGLLAIAEQVVGDR